MSKLSVEGFEWAAKDARGYLDAGRKGEHVLALIDMRNQRPFFAQFGDLKGKQCVFVRCCPLASYTREGGRDKLHFAYSNALHAVGTEEYVMELKEFNRVQLRMQRIIGVFPNDVRYYLANSTRPETVQAAQAWLFRLFSALTQLPNLDWARAAAVERERMTQVFRAQPAQEFLRIAA